MQVSRQVSDSLVVRGALDVLSIGRDEDYSGVDYDGKLKSTTAGLFLDLHPGGSAFYVSGGAYFGGRKLDLDAQPSRNVEIGGQSFTPAQVGRIDGRAKLSDFQPFVGAGFDNTFSREGSWGFRALVGVSFSKRPDVRLRAVGGLLANDANFQARLAQEERDLKDDAKDFRYYPIVQVGITRRF